MTLLEWKPAYALGIASVDHEHRELIAMINDLYAGMGEGAGPDTVEWFLEEIFAGISSHFALEERHMRQAGYSEFEQHKDDHEDLLDELRDMMDHFADNPKSGEAHLQEKLSDWFGRHFATFDARLHQELGDHP